MSGGEQPKKNKNSFFIIILFSLVISGIAKIFWPDSIPFGMFEFWKINNPVLEVLKVSWPVFAWGVVISAFEIFNTRNNSEKYQHAGSLYGVGCLISICAGVFEEISFRWLIFYGGIVCYEIINWLSFRWVGFGLVQWLHLHISAYIANFLTLGYLKPILFGAFDWTVGAALLTSNGLFMAGHTSRKYKILGIINGWFFGMFMFYLLFRFGLFYCIFVHFVYNLLIFTAVYLDAVLKRVRGY